MAERFRSYMGPGDKDLPRANEGLLRTSQTFCPQCD